jgi:flavin reductase (DIM6/NTAB) family NADH-FMN oxidoreductase RutF
MQYTVYQAADLAGMEKQFRTNLINSLSGFKSVNLVGTISPIGVTNLAIFSQVFHLGAAPALMGLLVRPDSVRRDTLTNLLATGYFTLNHIRPEFYEAAHQTSARYEESEFVATGLHPEIGPLHPAPYVTEAHVKIGLKFRERYDLAINGTVLIVGEVVEIIVRRVCVATDGYLDLEKAGSVTSSGLDAYHTTQRLGRLTYAKPHLASQQIGTAFLVADAEPVAEAPTQTAETVVQQLRELTKGLLYPSESEYPFVVEKTATPMLARSLDGPTLDDFFAQVATAQDWHGKTEQATAQRFQQLWEAIRDHLKDPHFFKSEGSPLKEVQIVGKVGEEWVRIATKVVET